VIDRERSEREHVGLGGVHACRNPWWFRATGRLQEAAPTESRSPAHSAELKDRGRRVSNLSPGVIETPLLGELYPDPDVQAEMHAQYKELAPLGRMGRVDEMASAILFLVSDDSSYSTGIDLVADGRRQPAYDR
jgi:Enoyl-(Acyl carrier protein) reductase